MNLIEKHFMLLLAYGEAKGGGREIGTKTFQISMQINYHLIDIKKE